MTGGAKRSGAEAWIPMGMVTWCRHPSSPHRRQVAATDAATNTLLWGMVALSQFC